MFFTNERLGSNRSYQGALDAFVMRCGVPLPQVHGCPEGTPAQAAAAYAKLLTSHPSIEVNQDSLPSFDLMLLGVGEDSHVGSLHPNSEYIQETGEVRLRA